MHPPWRHIHDECGAPSDVFSGSDWSKLERIVMNAHLENVKPRGVTHQSAEQWAPIASAPARVVGEAMLDLAGRDVIDGAVY